MVDIDDILKNFGINVSSLSVKSIKELSVGEKFFVPYESISLVVEPAGEKNKNYLFFLDLNSKKHYSNYGSSAKVEVYKISEDKYVLIEPIKDINDLLIGEKKVFSKEFIQEIISNIVQFNKQNIFNANPYTYNPEEGKESSKVYEKFFNVNYVYLWGTRDLKESEKAKILLSRGKFIAKKPKTKLTGSAILEKMKSSLALQDEVVKLLFDELNFHEIIVGKDPINGGIVLYGPGGTGKTTIMKSIADIFEELGAYVAKNDKNEFLKTSEVKDTKYYGAYTDYFEPKFANAIQEARMRGIPSLIPIDEGDIFIKKESDKENAHSSDMLNFWKGHVGNHKDIIVIVASNVLKKDLNDIAVRAERAVAVEIPLPNAEIAKKLILQFISYYKIELNEKLTEAELNDLSKVVVDNKKPGANISNFCKNFYGKVNSRVDKYSSGLSTEEIELEENELKGKPINKEIFIQRFKAEVLGYNFGQNEKSSVLSSNHISSEDEKLIGEVENVFEFVNTNLNKLEQLYNTKGKNLELLSVYMSNLIILNSNLEKYYEVKKIEKRYLKIKEIKTNVQDSISILENWKIKTYTNSSEYTTLVRFLHEIIANQD